MVRYRNYIPNPRLTMEKIMHKLEKPLLDPLRRRMSKFNSQYTKEEFEGSHTYYAIRRYVMIVQESEEGKYLTEDQIAQMAIDKFYWLLQDGMEFHVNTCDNCGKPMDCGYVMPSHDACSDECRDELCKEHYGGIPWDELYDEEDEMSDFYYTEWYDNARLTVATYQNESKIISFL